MNSPFRLGIIGAGFIADVIARIPLPQIRTQLAREVASRMPGAPPFGVES